jgi:uncharacterized membrane protein YeaQ/YmgE (transglycosylase-associated protein family)
MHLFWFLIVGIVAGWLAGLLIKGEGFGLLGDMLIGIIGAYIGGYLFGVLGLNVHGILGHIIMATAGASALLLVVRLISADICSGPAGRRPAMQYQARGGWFSPACTAGRARKASSTRCTSTKSA